MSSRLELVCLTALTLVLGACAGPSPQSTLAGAPPSAATSRQPEATPLPSTTQVLESRDGKQTDEVTGTAVSGSNFAKLVIGMGPNEVQEILGRTADRSHSYESGKRWIPFYFGNDARRTQALYKGEGCLIFTGGNIWGGAGGDLIGITHDASGVCYQP
jgi:hypothetical protein